jgi:hypothetical protein
MNGIVQAITHTPVWVWPLLALLIFIGIIALKPRSMPLPRLLILPAIFLGLSIFSLLSSGLPLLQAIAIWLAGLVLGGLLGRLFAPRLSAAGGGVVIDRAARRIAVPGSAVPLVLILVIFIGRYAFGYAFGRYPELRQNDLVVVTAAAYAAFCTGIMLGRTLPLVLAYCRAPKLDARR